MHTYRFDCRSGPTQVTAKQRKHGKRQQCGTDTKAQKNAYFDAARYPYLNTWQGDGVAVKVLCLGRLVIADKHHCHVRISGGGNCGSKAGAVLGLARRTRHVGEAGWDNVADVATAGVRHMQTLALGHQQRGVRVDEVVLPMVVGQHRLRGVSVRPDEGQRSGPLQWQQVVRIL